MNKSGATKGILIGLWLGLALAASSVRAEDGEEIPRSVNEATLFGIGRYNLSHPERRDGNTRGRACG